MNGIMASATTRLIRVSTQFIDRLATRDVRGHLLTVEWGEPAGSCGVEPGIVLDYYEPTITVHDDGHTIIRKDTVVMVEALIEAVLDRPFADPDDDAANAARAVQKDLRRYGRWTTSAGRGEDDRDHDL